MKGLGWIAASATGLALATAPALHAQVMALSPTTMVGYAGTTAAGAHARRQIGTRLATPSRTPAQASAPSMTQVLARTNYRPDPRIRQQVYARAVAQIQKGSPSDAAKLRQILVSGQMRNEVATYLRKYGMSPDNLVDTTTVYLAAAWLASRGNTGDPTPAQLRGLRNQVARTFSTMPQLLAAPEALKQELGEANILQASVSSAVVNQAAGQDPAYAAKARAAVVQGVKSTYQIDLSRMDLTANGLR
ncbi:DUF6683 family protein [Sphingomonas sp.]|jgi:hypothetical protein|uniref:DUF6683 family protein n=1 Tax=Sphingomonas sp. TaxID=28214 RepID=UPI0035C86617